MRILVVEDDSDTRSFVVKGLEESGHNAVGVESGTDGLHLARSEDFDALVIDRMLPEMDGLEIVRRLRSEDTLTPVLILSALGEVENRVAGLRAGSDDYLTKPFAFSELLARLDAIVRRGDSTVTQALITVDDLSVDLLKREVRRGGEKIDVKPTEFRILEVLMRFSGQVVTRTMLLEKVWDYNFDPNTSLIEVHISRLRTKVDKEFDYPLIHTVRGHGYVIRGRFEDQ